MSSDDMEKWIDDQFRKRGWSKGQIESGKKYKKWRFRTGIGGLSCLFVITAIFGLPLIVIGGVMMYRHSTPGKTYRKGREELKDEFKRRQRSGESLYEPVDEDWWDDRLPSSRGLEN